MAKLMRECWHQNPQVRLPALRIKKTIAKLATADCIIDLEDMEVCVWAPDNVRLILQIFLDLIFKWYKFLIVQVGKNVFFLFNS